MINMNNRARVMLGLTIKLKYVNMSAGLKTMKWVKAINSINYLPLVWNKTCDMKYLHK